MSTPAVRHMVIVLGDQLDREASGFDGFDPAKDMVWMAEASAESTQVWSAKARIVMFLSAMRHFAQRLRDEGVRLHYQSLDTPDAPPTLAEGLLAEIAAWRPARLILTHPGDWRVLQALTQAARTAGLPLEIREDRHFLCSLADFRRHAAGRKQLRMEFFYREMRARYGIMMEDGQPAQGRWNFDSENRKGFGPQGPSLKPTLPSFAPDAITRSVIALVNARFPKHPGSADDFDWPLTPEAAQQVLRAFIDEGLPEFGQWQDAMWPDEPFLWHSRLSAALNLKLISPRQVIAAAEAAWRAGKVPINSAEGFIRQILGWREYVRGIYWTRMPDYLQGNALEAHEPLPAFYWTGKVRMACLADVLGQTLRFGYAHHIQRLMVANLYALLLGVAPQQVHEWFLAVYVDAVEWVELPNTLGMGQAADGGLMASKPYIASGKYIDRMCSGSLCARCPFDPALRTGKTACPFTTLYWDFLLRHEALLRSNPRTALQVKNIQTLTTDERAAITGQAASIRAAGGIPA